jgi:hypothetical protein
MRLRSEGRRQVTAGLGICNPQLLKTLKQKSNTARSLGTLSDDFANLQTRSGCFRLEIIGEHFVAAEHYQK